MNLFKKLAGQAAIYGLSSMIGKAVNFLLIPFYTKVLTTADFGVMSDLYAMVALANIILCFGLETTYFRFANKEGEQKTFNNSVSFLIVFTGLITTFLSFQATSIVSFINYPGKEVYIYALAGVLFIDAMMSIPFARLRQQNKAKRFAIIRLANISLNIFFNVLFLIILKDTDYYNPAIGVGYIFIANLLANAFFIPMLLPSFKGFRFTINKTYLNELITYAYPIIFTGIAQMINEVIDRRMLLIFLPKNHYSNFTNMEAVGIYSACYKFSMFMSLVTQSFRYAAEPFFFSKADKKDAPETYAIVLKWFIVATSILFVAVSLFRYLIADVILQSPDYHTGLTVVPILLLANLFLGVYYNQSIWYKVTNKTYWGTYITIAGAAITMAGNYILIPIYGYTGSAITTLICYATISILSYFLGQKFYPIPYHIGSGLFSILFASTIVLIGQYLYQENNIQSFLIATGLFFTYLGLIFLIEKKNLPSKS